jgi:hypothetical protein
MDAGNQTDVPNISPDSKLKMNDILKELGKVVKPEEPNRPKLKRQKPKTERPNSGSEDVFVTATYREPITANVAKTPSPLTSPHLSPSSTSQQLNKHFATLAVIGSLYVAVTNTSSLPEFGLSVLGF